MTPRRQPRRPTQAISRLETHERAHVTPRALAEYLSVDRKTVLKWIKAGLLPAYRFPTVTPSGIAADGEWRIQTVDARAFVDKHRLTPSPSSPQ